MKPVVFALTVIVWAFGAYAVAQQASIAMGAAPYASASVAAPTDLIASDGTYDKFVLLRWSASAESAAYKVFRATSMNAASLQEISQGWQKSTWFCDYSALPDVDYYYAVMATDGKRNSAASQLDKGFLRRNAPVANDTERLLSSTEAYGAPQPAFLMVASVELPPQGHAPGNPLEITLNLENIFDKEVPPTELRFYLSADTVFDWNDLYLDNRILSNIPANTTFQLTQTLRLPTTLVAGDYQLVVVGSTEGAILSSKTYFATLKISPR